MPLFRVPRCKAFQNLSELADDTDKEQWKNVAVSSLDTISESDSSEIDDIYVPVATEIDLSGFKPLRKRGTRRRGGNMRRDFRRRNASDSFEPTEFTKLDSVYPQKVEYSSDPNFLSLGRKPRYESDASSQRPDIPVFLKTVQIKNNDEPRPESDQNWCIINALPPASPIESPLSITPPIFFPSPHRNESLRCRLCNELFGSTLDMENHLVSSTHKRQARCFSLMNEFMDSLQPISAVKEIKYRNDWNLKAIAYDVRRTLVIRNLDQLLEFCDFVQRKWSSDFTYVGFDTERVAVSKVTSHVVILQICLCPFFVVLVAIRDIVGECNGIFPLSLLHLLRRFILVGVKVTEDINALVKTFDLSFDSTRPERPTGCAIRTLELNELGKWVFGPRCETGTWGLQSLFERIDPGYTIPKNFNLRVSDWSKSLTEAQIGYAATDAAVGLFIFQELIAKIHSSLFEDYHGCPSPFRCDRLGEKLERIVETCVVVA